MLQCLLKYPAVLGVTGVLCCLGFLYFKFGSFNPNAPGVGIAKYTDLWYFWQVWRGDFEQTNIGLHKKYGKVVRIGPSKYSIDDSEAIKTIYGHGTQFEKSDWYRPWSPPQIAHINLFTCRKIKVHASERRKVASMYSMSALLSYESYVDNCITHLGERFREFSSSQQQFDIVHWMQCFAFDVIGEITLGNRFGFLDAGHDIQGIIKGLETYTTRSTLCGIYPSLSSVALGLFGNGTTTVVNFIAESIRNYPSSTRDATVKGTGVDFLTKLKNLRESNSEKYTTQDVFAVCAQNIGAGSDTTSISLSSIFYQVLQRPDVLSRLRAEIDDIYSGGKIDGVLSFESTQKLPYLQAVIKEGLRIHPATGLPLWRVVPDGGAQIAGQYFPAGAEVGVNTWVAHYSSLVFGPDARLFRPERWLESTPEQLSAMERYYMPFGLGSRTCIGKNISLLEISKVTPYLVRNFDFDLLQNRWSHINHWFVKPRRFEVKVSHRNYQTSSL